ncbi:RNA polymerase sigma factor [Nannocystaceae bacterium ST9]
MSDLAPTESAELPSGFGDLYAAHYDFLWRCALRMGVAPTDVEDAIQETFIVALRRYDVELFRAGRARPSTWLYAILHNVLRNHARGERRRRARLERLADGEGVLVMASSPSAEARLGLRLLDEFLVELDVEQRSVFVLAELEGMRGPEIAAALGLNVNTARSRLRSARLAFRDRFADDRGELVEQATRVRAPAAARARGLVGLALPSRAWWGSASASSLAGSKLFAGVALAIGVGVGAGLLGQIEGEREPAAEPAQVVSAAPIAVEPAVASRAEEPAIVVESTLAESTLAESTLAEGRTKVRSDPDLGQALDTLARARRALLEGDAQLSLELLAERRWPATLEARRVALEVGALCSLGRSDQARERAHEWLDAHPDLDTALELRAPCWDEPNDPIEHGHSPTR